MTHPVLHRLIPLVSDLSKDIPAAERYQRLLQALHQLLPCDALALLRWEDDHLRPVAVHGLSPDTLGRRFTLADQPRLAYLLAERAPRRIPADSPWPDPYDGLVDNHQEQLQVHDCVGCPVYVHDDCWGLITLDALQPGRFAEADLATLEAFAELAAATVMTIQRLEQLAKRADIAQSDAERYRLALTAQAEHTWIGDSAASQRLLSDIECVATSDLTVLISGETGVGKELVASALHAQSRRAEQPLVSVNCAALPENLVESELFGHVRGAFSGALNERRGKFEWAHQGTLFLDEVGELPLSVQAKLLRALQSGQIQRVGSDHEHRVDVRIVAATNRDLAEEVAAGRFRADLYHRLSVYPLRVPALRERGQDVWQLAGYFLEQNRSRLGLRGLRLDPEAYRALQRYDWPGNVRELEHLIARAALNAMRHMSDDRIVTLTETNLDLPQLAAPVDKKAVLISAPATALSLREAVDNFQSQRISEALQQAGGSWTEAAQHLQTDRANLRRLAKRLGILGA